MTDTAAPPTGKGLLQDVNGIYDFISLTDYHADPVFGGSLSSSGARKLLLPSCPAKFKWDLDHPQPPTPKSHYDMGHAAHRLVLGGTLVSEKFDPVYDAKENEVEPGYEIVRGDSVEIVVIDAQDWKRKAVQALRDQAHADGRVPLLRKDYQVAQDMAASLLKDKWAAALLAPGSGVAEQTLVWRDPVTRVMLRARPDWLPHPHDLRYFLPDVKTARSAEPEQFGKASYDYGNHQQMEHYVDGVRELGIASDPIPVLIVVEKEPPYIVQVFQIDDRARAAGRLRNDEARQIYETCRRTKHWPTYSDRIELLSLPAWAERKEGVAG